MTTPRFHTPRNPDRRTLGRKAGKVAALLGTPYMPWQQMAADVALEVDDAGRFVYHTVIVSVPRQAGKTAFVMSTGLHRTLTTPGCKTWYTAQTGQVARERFLGDMADPAERVLRGIIRVKRGAGDTRLVVPSTLAQFRPHPPTADSLHSEQSDLNLIDECWAHTPEAGEALMQAVVPTQNTRPNAQTVFLSTMGDAGSTWWHDMVDEARAGKPGVCIIDYGVPIDADGYPLVDATDPAEVAPYHPAIGHTIEPQVLDKAREQFGASGFARAYGNVPSRARTAIVTPELLDRADTDAPIPAESPIVIAAAVSWDRDVTAVVAVGQGPDGHPLVEVIQDRPGHAWAADYITAVARAQRPAAVVVDPVGPSAGLHADLVQSGVELAPLTAREVSAAHVDLLDRVSDDDGPRVWFRPRVELRTEWSGLAMRTVADTGRMFSRRHSAGSIARLEAAALGVAAFVRRPAPAPAPLVWIGQTIA